MISVRQRLDLALKLGADAVINTLDKDYVEQAMALTDNKGYGFVYETAGNTITMQ